MNIRNIDYSCTPGPGWTLVQGQKVKDARYTWSAYAVCLFKGPNNNGYEVVYRHSWATSGRVMLYRQGCSAGKSSPNPPPHEALNQCNSADPVLWATYGFEHESFDARPPAPPVEARRVQGKKVGAANDTAIRNARIFVRNRDIDPPNGGIEISSAPDGSFSHVLPADWPETYAVRVEVPAGYTVSFTACSNETGCHDPGNAFQTNEAEANPKPGKYLDIRFYFEKLPPPPGKVQGFKMKDFIFGTKDQLPVPAGMNVYLDNVPSWFRPDRAFEHTNVSAGLHWVTVDEPPGWNVGYTLCYNRTDCHTPANLKWGAGVQVDVPSNGFVDIWWHYYREA